MWQNSRPRQKYASRVQFLVQLLVPATRHILIYIYIFVYVCNYAKFFINVAVIFHGICEWWLRFLFALNSVFQNYWVYSARTETTNFSNQENDLSVSSQDGSFQENLSFIIYDCKQTYEMTLLGHPCMSNSTVFLPPPMPTLLLPSATARQVMFIAVSVFLSQFFFCLYDIF